MINKKHIQIICVENSTLDVLRMWISIFFKNAHPNLYLCVEVGPDFLLAACWLRCSGLLTFIWWGFLTMG